jgi:isoleucyl-tRNA synthetase
MGEDGTPMHKSKGNLVVFDDAAERVGSDTMRWLFAIHNPEKNLSFPRIPTDEDMEKSAQTGLPVRLSEKWMLVRRILDKLWNVYGFFVTYANIDAFDPTKYQVSAAQRSELDRWILSELQQTIQVVTKGLEQYDTSKPAEALQEFLEDLSNWYLRRSRERFWKKGMDSDKVAAYLTLYESLTTLVTLLAPIIPFATEKMYQNLVRSVNLNAPTSVHLSDWPEVNEALLDERLSSETQLVMRVVSLGRAAREQAQIKVRQPLNALYVRMLNPLEDEALLRHSEQVLEELNMKHLHILSNSSNMLAYTLKPQVKILGPKYGPLVQKILTAFKSLDAHGASEAANLLNETGKLNFTIDSQQIELTSDEIEVIATARPGFVATEERGYVVALETTITSDLREEGLVRDLTHYIQDMRKKAGFNIEDHIALTLYTNDDLATILHRHQTTIQSETLADSLSIFVDQLPTQLAGEVYRENISPHEMKKLENYTVEVVLSRL